MRQSRYTKAKSYFQQALRLDKTLVDAHHNLGLIYAGEGKPEAAIKSFEQALEIYPEAVHTYYGMGNAYAQLRQTEKAIEAYRRTLELQSDHDKALYELARLYVKGNIHLSDALNLAQRAAVLRPMHAKYHALLAGIYFLNEEYETAETELLSAIHLDPDNPTYQENLATLQQSK